MQFWSNSMAWLRRFKLNISPFPRHFAEFSGKADTFRTKGPAIYLAQSKELKVPQGWVFVSHGKWKGQRSGH